MNRRTLSKEVIKRLQPKDKTYEVFDDQCDELFVRVHPTGRKVYVLKLSRTQKRNIPNGDALKMTITAARAYADSLLREKALEQSTGIESEILLKRSDITFGEFYAGRYKSSLLAKVARKNAEKSPNEKPDKLPPDFKRVENHFKFIFHRPINKAITLYELENWRDSQAGTLMNGTINRTITALSSVLNLALHYKLIAKHPFARRISKLPTTDRVRYLSDTEEEKLFQALVARDKYYREARQRTNQHRRKRKLSQLPEKPHFGNHLLMMVILAQQTGVRKSNLAALKKSKLFLDRNIIHVPTTKNGEYLNVVLNDYACELLKLWLKQNEHLDNEFVFPSPSLRKSHIRDPKKAWFAVLKRIGLKDFHWHDLRHDFATKLASSGVDLRTIADRLGHKTIDQTMKYAHLHPDYIKNSVGKLVPRAQEMFDPQKHFESSAA